MGEFEISCVYHDRNNVITHVGVNGRLMPVIDIINAMSGDDTFHTLKNGVRARVYRKQYHITRNWFLTTEPDFTNENNLDFLPRCTIR